MGFEIKWWCQGSRTTQSFSKSMIVDNVGKVSVLKKGVVSHGELFNIRALICCGLYSFSCRRRPSSLQHYLHCQNWLQDFDRLCWDLHYPLRYVCLPRFWKRSELACWVSWPSNQRHSRTRSHCDKTDLWKACGDNRYLVFLRTLGSCNIKGKDRFLQEDPCTVARLG